MYAIRSYYVVTTFLLVFLIALCAYASPPFAGPADPLDTSYRITSYNVCYTKLLRFQNLISNSIKFCRDPSPRIHVTALRNDKNETVFSVRDNGIGIAAEHTEDRITSYNVCYTKLLRFSTRS